MSVCKICRTEYRMVSMTPIALVDTNNARWVLVPGSPQLASFGGLLYCPACHPKFFNKVRDEGKKKVDPIPSFDTTPKKVHARGVCDSCLRTHDLTLNEKGQWVCDDLWVFTNNRGVIVSEAMIGKEKLPIRLRYCPQCYLSGFYGVSDSKEPTPPEQLSVSVHSSSSSTIPLEHKVQQYLWDIRIDPEQTAEALAVELLTCTEEEISVYEELESICLSVSNGYFC